MKLNYFNMFCAGFYFAFGVLSIGLLLGGKPNPSVGVVVICFTFTLSNLLFVYIKHK